VPISGKTDPSQLDDYKYYGNMSPVENEEAILCRSAIDLDEENAATPVHDVIAKIHRNKDYPKAVQEYQLKISKTEPDLLITI